ncbi:FecCD family ABC transporter permease [Paenibacillus macquariensis]|uniref:Iron complex transport system permease protein n=1 Tax=Paenibacillus macquariensis TaxID=948756 RepID=A0ABY1KC05_9BACL|nr:iron ABC transporter permease [Paenibacillus macquariensis]MEC0089582.1 iron ABC transporter permease [Paenibacillus macquariensis]OAB30923.1 iron ABC transporter permease [Paenibacillus macquariensis subsp. macquariensis]SIR58061.1 iron complex transport system permease protein [Paenibacillus macquariensis]
MSKYTPLRWNKTKLSFLIEKRTLWIIAALLVLCATLVVISTGVGSKYVSPFEVIQSIAGKGSSMNEVIIMKLRLPRILIAVLVGASLAVAGAVLQGIIRNPLASPDVTGITEGASLGTVLFIFFLSEKVSIQWAPLAAIGGAFIVTALLYLLSWKNGASPLRMILIGTGLSAAFKSISYMFIISGSFILANKSMIFMTGSIYGSSWEKDVSTLLPWVLILLPLTWIQSRHVNVQALGDDVAASAGANVQLHRLILLLLSVALAGAAVAIGGAITFIGLMAPHIARKLVGSSFGGLLPVSALLGALILLISDLIARTLFAPLDIPAGVFTAAIGVPFFLYLLYRNRNA